MFAGYGKIEITPPLGVELAGYGYYLQRKAVAVRDPLYVRAVLMQERLHRALIVSCDLLGLSDDVCKQVYDQAHYLGVEIDEIMLLSVHTHTGPVIKDHEGCGVPDPDYVASLPGKILQAIDMAVDDLKPVESLTFHEITPPPLITESPAKTGGMKHGFAVPGVGSGLTYNRAIQDGPVDRTIRGFMLTRRGGRPIAMASGACHAVFNGVIPEISADYPGAVNQLLTDAGYDSIYLNGMCGDIDPAEKSQQSMWDYARQIAGVFDAPGTALPFELETANPMFILHNVAMTPQQMRDAVQAVVDKAGGPDQPAARPALVWEQNMLAGRSSKLEMEMVFPRICVLGGVPICAVPFEGYTAIGQMARQISNQPHALMLGCLCEMKGYLPTVDDIAAGGYAALESTFLYRRPPVQPGQAEALAEFLGSII